MFKTWIYTALFTVLVAMPVMAAETGYISAIEDLPLMAGMSELSKETLSFDTPQGRIVEIAAETQASKKDVAAFYQNTLPALGWQLSGAAIVHLERPMTYVRASEQLTLQIEQVNDRRIVRFSLTPKNIK